MVPTTLHRVNAIIVGEAAVHSKLLAGEICGGSPTHALSKMLRIGHRGFIPASLSWKTTGLEFLATIFDRERPKLSW